MPRRPSIILPGSLLSIIQRGSNRQACCYADEDYPAYLEWLREYAVCCHNRPKKYYGTGAGSAAAITQHQGDYYLQADLANYRRIDETD